MDLPPTHHHRLPAAIDRRRALTGGAAALVLLGSSARAAPGELVVDTTAGKLRGLAANGAHVFKGIPYAASTAGPNRFLPPQPVQPWAGVRNAHAYGATAPQARDFAPSRASTPASAVPAVGEDCLVLNVFTPGVGRGGRRPVMVWMHGGGWWVGSGSAPTQDGSALARAGDVVIVTVNHRLNLFGHIRLEDEDPRFADSGNAGVLDMVAALQWVRDNIAAFGGDPANVTIFGVSGGGAKVSALMATPAAQGLFHKVIAQSCSGSVRIVERPEATKMAHDLARHLGIARPTGEALQKVPVAALVKAMLATSVRFRPILDGRTFTRHPFDPDAPPISRHIPFMAGNMANETTIHLSRDPANFSLDLATVRGRLARYLPASAAETNRIVEAYRAAYPAATPSELLAAVTTDYQYHRNTRREVELQALAGRAPAYSYIFEWPCPAMDGKLKAYHGMDIPFVFGTTHLARHLLGTSPDVAALSADVMATWTSFARSGNPNNPRIPHWPRFDAQTRPTMMLNRPSRVAADPGGRARSALDSLPYFEYSVPLSFISASANPSQQAD